MSESSARGAGEAADAGIAVLRNTFAVLRTFSVDEPLLGVTTIASMVGLHKSTVSRILATLEAENIVERDPASRRFQLGLGVIGLAGPLLADLDVRRAAEPVLRETSERTGETAALMVWGGAETICVEQVPSRHQVKHSTPLGTRYDTVASSSVQVFLAHMHPERARALLAAGTLSYAGLDDSAVDDWLERLGEVRERGFAVNYGETSVQEVGISAGVFDHRGDVIAAILTSAPRFRVSPEQVDLLGQATSDAADQVTSRLGGTPDEAKD